MPKAVRCQEDHVILYYDNIKIKSKPPNIFPTFLQEKIPINVCTIQKDFYIVIIFFNNKKRRFFIIKK